MKKILYIAAIIAITNLQFSIAHAQQPDAIYKLLRHEWTVNTDGTSDYHYRHEVKILRNRALTAYADKGETFVVYNPDIEDLTINEVYTIREDGNRVEMPQNAFVYQLPSQCTDCGRFNHIRELAMIHTGMEYNCVIVVDYTIHRRYNLLNLTLPLVKECPIEQLEVSITMPTDMNLDVQLNNPGLFPFNPTVEQTTNTYTLKALNIAQNYNNAYMPEYSQVYPTLHFYNGTPEFTPAFDQNGLPEAKDAAYRQIQGHNDLDDIISVRNFVVDNIHLNDLPAAMLGYTHATAAEVWRTGCGTATDKAVLLAAMLNQLKFNARVTGERMDEVGVIIDTNEYRLNVRYKTPLTIYGEAKDEMTTVNSKINHTTCNIDTLEDGFFLLALAPIKESPRINSANLAPTRTAPLASPLCDIDVHEEYTLPKGMKMVGAAVDRQLSFQGLGSVKINVKQKGKKLVVDRKLKLEKSLVTSADYPNYRCLIAIWQSTDNILLRSK